MAGLILRVRALVSSRRRAGFGFTAEAVDLRREEFAEDDLAAYQQVLAIATDPELVCFYVGPEGEESRPTSDDIEKLREHIATLQASDGNAAVAGGMTEFVEQLLDGKTELQPASGAEGETGGAAASSGDASASSGEPNASGSLESSPGTETSSADASGQTREEADASTADRKVDANVGNQPEDTPQPPAAELDTENGPSAAPAAKPAGRAKPKSATEAKA